MCLILFAYDIHEDYRLVFAANRDEFYQRPTQAVSVWNDAPDIIAGRDLKAGGTWLGMSRKGRLAAITNYRDPSTEAPDPLSRGMLVTGFLCNGQSAESYVRGLKAADVRNRYNGFNLLVGDGTGLWYFSNRGPEPVRLKPGVYGLSNHLLDTAWPKVAAGKRRLKTLLKEPRSIEPEALFRMLSDRTIAPDAELPQTGVELAWERTLSPLFITSPHYGTRSSSLILMRKNGRVQFLERSYDSGETRRHDFTIPAEEALPPPA